MKCATQMAEAERDSWKIEVTGGPLTERPTDPNYKIKNLTTNQMRTQVEQYINATKNL